MVSFTGFMRSRRWSRFLPWYIAAVVTLELIVLLNGG